MLRLKIDMRERQRQHARPGDLPDPPRVAPSHRRHVVHLSALRLHARHLGRAGAHHALDLHAGVPGPSPALRLGDREARRRRAARAPAAAAIRVRAAQPHVCRAVEAPPGRAGGRAARRRLGRSADAHAGRRAPPRFHAGGLPPARRADRRFQDRLLDRHERARGLHARRSQRARAAAHRGARSGEARDRQLSRRARARTALRRIIRSSPNSAGARCR